MPTSRWNGTDQPTTQDSADGAPPPGRGGRITFPGNDGRPHTVGFDEHSFLVDGQRLQIWSGELHHWRVPSAEGWRDVFQKLRASGFNAVSLYFFWGLHQYVEGGPFNFEGIRDIDRLLALAAEEGLYVIARPGPYVNAEISMGGLPGFMVNKSARSLRSLDPRALEPSKAWLHTFNEIACRHQVTDGGGSILLYQVENELIADDEARRGFLRTLAEFVRSDGIDVPLFHNDYGLAGRFSDVADLGLDFYAYDRYPLGFNCAAGRGLITDTESDFRRFAPRTPQFITEAQGGAFTPWGAAFNTEACEGFVDPAFTRQWGMINLGNGVTAFNYYMITGGTNWGYTGSPSSGFTSYDYGAALSEDRVITPKLAVQKELGYFQLGLPQLSSMRPVEAPSPAEVSGAPLRVYARQATDDDSATGNGARFLGVCLADSNDVTDTTLTIPLVLDRGADAGLRAYTHDDRSLDLVWVGDWERVDDPSAHGGTLTRSAAAGASVALAFEGTGLEVIAPRGTAYGSATITIDGGGPVGFDAWIASDQNAPAQQVVHSTTGLAPGLHTATIEVVGQPAPDNPGGGIAVAIDALNVLGDDAASASAKRAAEATPAGGAPAWPRIPQEPTTSLRVHGRDALLLAADFRIGDHGVLYTTSQLFGAPVRTAAGLIQTLVGYPGDPGETVLVVGPGLGLETPEGVTATHDVTARQLRLNYTHGAPIDVTVTDGGEALTLRFMDRGAAARTWHVRGTRGDGNDTVIVRGAYLVRAVAFEGTTAHIAGSMDAGGALHVTLPAGITNWTWNGQLLDGDAPGPRRVDEPRLEWVRAEEAPEAAADFDDSSWLLADAPDPLNPWQGPGGSGVVLDSNRYGFFEGTVWYRATYTAAGDDPTLTLRGNGGSGVPAHGRNPAFMQVWVDGAYAGAHPAAGDTVTVATPEGLVRAGEPVTVAVAVHNLGHNLDWSDDGLSRQNRGLFEAHLGSVGPVTWRIRGADHRFADATDPVRGLYNHGGLHGELAGWHLPDHPTTGWLPATDFVAPAPGIAWYRTTATLSVPEGQDTAWRLEVESTRFEAGRTDGCQVNLYVNGWLSGIYIGDIGPQKSFTVPAGFIDPRGSNDIAVAVIAKDAGMGPQRIRLVPHFSTTGVAS